MRSLVWKLVLAALTLALVAAPVAGTSTAWAASPALEEAQALYDGANFADAIAKIRAGLSSGELAGNDAIAARALMARCLVKSGNRLEAKQAFKFVLRQQPGWRPDASVGPDEREVFELAQRELTAEQIEAGKRIPASLSFNMGPGSGDNEDMADFATQLGAAKGEYDNKPQIGGAVRFPVTRTLSLELELQRLRATNQADETELEITAYPVFVSLYHSTYSRSMFRANLFVGGGLLSSAISKLEIDLNTGSGTVPISLSGQKNGAYFHGGLEAEFLAHPRLAVTARMLGRYAKANSVLDEYGELAVEYKDRDIDFSGFAATFGLRAYIGY